jgi:hypothetical protein
MKEDEVGDIIYGKRKEGAGRECVLWAVVLELRCIHCDQQERWRGRTGLAVANVARLAGWMFNSEMAACPEHSGVKRHVFHAASRKAATRRSRV